MEIGGAKMNKEFLGIDRRGPKIITNHKIQGLLRNDIFIIRKVPLVEIFPSIKKEYVIDWVDIDKGNTIIWK